MRATESHDLVLNDVIVPFENFVETNINRNPMDGFYIYQVYI